MRNSISIFLLMACVSEPTAVTSEEALSRAYEVRSYGGLSRSDLIGEREIRFFNESLQEIVRDHFPGATLSDCKDAVQLAVGKINGNIVYGANCTIADGEGRTYASICADEMVGYFAILESGLKPSGRDEIADWTYQNCGQGG